MNVPVYFFDMCYNLADNYPGDTVNTADTYAVFAAVSGLDFTIPYI